jgi:hypothetical protein
MANKTTAAQIKEMAKRNVLDTLADAFENVGAERYGSDFEMAIPTIVEGQELWVGIVLTAKQYTKTKVSDPFDPFVLREEYDAEQNIKAKQKAENAAKKAKKISKDKARRAESEEKGE